MEPVSIAVFTQLTGGTGCAGVQRLDSQQGCILLVEEIQTITVAGAAYTDNVAGLNSSLFNT